MQKKCTPLSLDPGRSVGPFELGSTLWDILNHIRSSRTQFPQAQVAWDSKSPNTSPILLTIQSPPVRLVFNGSSQRLSLVEVLEPGKWLIYRGKSLNGSVDGANRKSVYRLFGPTYPPTLHPASSSSKQTGWAKEELITYPGVAFGFPPSLSRPEKDDAEDPKLFRVIVTPTVSEMAGERGGVEETTHQESAASVVSMFDLALPRSPPCADGDLDRVYVQLGDIQTSQPTTLNLTFHSDHSSSSSLPPIPPVKVTLNETTSEDLICELGQPLRVFWKEDDRLRIHSHLGGHMNHHLSTSPPNKHQISSPSPSSTTLEPNGFFLSYFSLGIDFLIHPTSFKVVKVVLHSNIPGEVLFGRYGKCRWTLLKPKEGGGGKGDEVKKRAGGNGNGERVAGKKKGSAVGKKEKKREEVGEDEGDVEEDCGGEDEELGRAKKGGRASASTSGDIGVEETDKAPTIAAYLENAPHKATRMTQLKESAMVLDRTADAMDGLTLSRKTKLVGFPGVVLELTADDDVETLWLF